MSLAPELRAVLEHRMESMRAAQQGIDDLINAAMEDRSLSARLTEAMPARRGSSWIPMLCAALFAQQSPLPEPQSTLGDVYVSYPETQFWPFSEPALAGR